MINTAELIPVDARTILKVSDAQAANIAAANARTELFKTDAQKMKELEAHFRAVLKTQCESYKNHVIETFLDCDHAKIKVSKRIARVPKYARGYVK